jgi:hypothetical protein
MANPQVSSLATITWEGTAVADTTKVSVNRDVESKEYASSTTAGVKRRLGGVTDAKGSFEVLQDVPPFDENDIGTLVVTSDGATELFNGEALIKSIKTDVDWEKNEIIKSMVEWEKA